MQLVEQASSSRAAAQYPHKASKVLVKRYKTNPGDPANKYQKMAAKMASLPFSNTDSIVARVALHLNQSSIPF